jgi:hypothetical protein
MTTMHEVPGVRTTFRTDPECGIVIATLWVDDEPHSLLGTLSLRFLDGPGGPLYQGWVDLIASMVNAKVEELLGIERGTLRVKRRKARD